MSQWLSTAMPQLTDKKAYFQNPKKGIKDEVTQGKGRGISKQHELKIKIATWLTKDFDSKFEEFEKWIANAAEANLSTYDPSANLVLVTNAILNYWSTILGLQKKGKDEAKLEHYFASKLGVRRNLSSNLRQLLPGDYLSQFESTVNHPLHYDINLTHSSSKEA